MIKIVIIVFLTLYIVSVFIVRRVLLHTYINKPLDGIDLIYILVPVVNISLVVCKIFHISFIYLKGKTKMFIKWFMTGRRV